MALPVEKGYRSEDNQGPQKYVSAVKGEAAMCKRKSAKGGHMFPLKGVKQNERQ
jgi:hypothetical protein